MIDLSTVELTLLNVYKKDSENGRTIGAGSHYFAALCICIYIYMYMYIYTYIHSVRGRDVVFGSMSLIHTTFQKFFLVPFYGISCHFLHSRNSVFKLFAHRILFYDIGSGFPQSLVEFRKIIFKQKKVTSFKVTSINLYTVTVLSCLMFRYRSVSCRCARRECIQEI
jgi:cytochrome c biogenesis factor